VSTVVGRTRYRLGQDIEPDVMFPEAVTASAGTPTDVSPEQAGSFASLWQRFSALWPEVQQQREQIFDQRERWRALARQAYEAGDMEGFRAYSARITALDALEADRQQAESLVQRFRDAWDSLKTYLSAAGRWLGISSLGGLGLPPLVLAVGLPAALAALAWVVNTILRIRAELAADRQLLEAAERGVISGSQAVQAITQRERASGALVSIGGGSWSGLLLLGAVGLGLWFLMGSRR